MFQGYEEPQWDEGAEEEEEEDVTEGKEQTWKAKREDEGQLTGEQELTVND